MEEILKDKKRTDSIVAVLLGIVGALSVYWFLMRLSNGYIFVGGSFGIYQIGTLLSLFGGLLFACAALYSAWSSYKGEDAGVVKGVRLMAVFVLLDLVGDLLLYVGLFTLSFASCMELAQTILRFLALRMAVLLLSGNEQSEASTATTAVVCLGISCVLDLIVIPLAYSIMNGHGFALNGLALIWELCLFFAIYVLIGSHPSSDFDVSSKLWSVFHASGSSKALLADNLGAVAEARSGLESNIGKDQPRNEGIEKDA